MLLKQFQFFQSHINVYIHKRVTRESYYYWKIQISSWICTKKHTEVNSSHWSMQYRENMRRQEIIDDLVFLKSPCLKLGGHGLICRF